MSFKPGSVWGNTYRENREQSLAARNNVGYGSNTSYNISYGAPNYNLGAFQSSNQFGGDTNAFSSTTETHLSGFQTNHHFGRYLKPSSNTNHTITSCDAPEKRLDWGFIVDNVFKEEIGKMAEEFKNGK